MCELYITGILEFLQIFTFPHLGDIDAILASTKP